MLREGGTWEGGGSVVYIVVLQRLLTGFGFLDFNDLLFLETFSNLLQKIGTR